MDVSFYQLLKTPLEKALPKLVEKIYQGGYRTLIVCENQAQVELLNTVLWTFSPGAFIPHGCEGLPKHQPIWLTTELVNANEANLVILTNGQYVKTKEFEKCIDIFDGNDEKSLKNARERYTDYKNSGFKMAFWRQNETGGWENV